jgi:hypothetical protein
MDWFGGGRRRRDDEDEDEEDTWAQDWDDPPPRAPPASRRAVHAADAAAPSLAAAPAELLLAVFRALATDDRMRCREVCGGWLDLLCDPALWTALDLAGGLYLSLASEDFLRAASRLSGHRLARVDLSGCIPLHLAWLKQLMRRNAETLTAVTHGRGGDSLTCGLRPNPALRRNPFVMFEGDTMLLFTVGVNFADARRLARRASPNVAALTLDVRATAAQAGRLLGNAYAPLVVRRLTVQPAGEDVRHVTHSLGQHPSLRDLDLTYLDAGDEPREEGGRPAPPQPLSAAFGDFVTALVGAPNVETLSLSEANLCPAAVAHLGRAVGTLRSLDVCGLFDGQHELEDITPPFAVRAPELCAGLRASRTLRVLSLKYTQLFGAPAAGAEVLAALTGHPTLRELHIAEDGEAAAATATATEARAAAGAALAALVAADGLHTLHVRGVPLDAPGFAALCASLGGTQRLADLQLSCFALRLGGDALGALGAAVERSQLLRLSCACGDCDACGEDADALRGLERAVLRRAHARGLADDTFAPPPDSSDEDGDSDAWEDAEDDEEEEEEADEEEEDAEDDT